MLQNKTLPILRSVFFIFLFAVCSAASYGGSDHIASPVPLRFLLTFDDGPSGDRYNNSTEQVLDVLASNAVQPGIKAIFFIQTRANRGGGTEIGKKLMQREWQEGHLLEFHTSTPHHSNHRFLSEQELNESLQNGVADLTAVTGMVPQILRPPFWS